MKYQISTTSVRETEVLVELQPLQGVFVCDHAALEINEFSPTKPLAESGPRVSFRTFLGSRFRVVICVVRFLAGVRRVLRRGDETAPPLGPS